MPEQAVHVLRPLLVKATETEHIQLHHHPLLKDVMSASYPLTTYSLLLSAYHTIYSTLEQSVMAYLGSHSIDFDYQPRLKLPLLQKDLVNLNISVPSPSVIQGLSPYPAIASLGDLIGSLYVLEGSTLGASRITLCLAKHHQLHTDNGAAFFNGYGEHTRDLWQQFLSFAEQSIAHDPEQCALAIASAKNTFDYFKRSLDDYYQASFI